MGVVAGDLTIAAATTARRRPDLPLMSPAVLFAGSASETLAHAVEQTLNARFTACTAERFPDGEVAIALQEPVRDRETIILQATCAPVNDHLVELLALVDACRRAAASRIVTVIPYFGYARSDRRDGRRTPITASLVASLLQTAGVDQVVTLDVHTPAIEGFFHVPVDNISAVPVLAERLRTEVPHDAIVVSPDLGAVRLANRYAQLLELPTAVCHKQRISGTEVSINRITGDVLGRPCLIVDDMIATGSTVVEAVRALRHAGALAEITVAATHAVFVSGAVDKLEEAGVRKLVVTDSIRPSARVGRLAPEIVSIAPLVATAIRRLLEGGSLRELA